MTVNPATAKHKELEITRRRARVIELREEGLTFREISKELGVSLGLVHKDFAASIERILEPNVAAYRAEHVARLHQMRGVTQDILDRRHVVVQQGHVVSEILGSDDDGQPIFGEPLEDDSIVLAAMDRLHKIDEAERKLLGLDARPEVQITGSLRYVIEGLDDADGDS
jgi:hypothetical protein